MNSICKKLNNYFTNKFLPIVAVEGIRKPKFYMQYELGYRKVGVYKVSRKVVDNYLFQHGTTVALLEAK